MYIDFESLKNGWELIETVIKWALFLIGIPVFLNMLYRYLMGDRIFALRGERLNYVPDEEEGGRLVAVVEPAFEGLTQDAFHPWDAAKLQNAARRARRTKEARVLVIADETTSKNVLTTFKGLVGMHLSQSLDRYLRAYLRATGKRRKSGIIRVYIAAVQDNWTDDKHHCIRFFFFFDWEVEKELAMAGWLKDRVVYSIDYQSDKADHLTWVAEIVARAEVRRATSGISPTKPLRCEDMGVTELRLGYDADTGTVSILD